VPKETYIPKSFTTTSALLIAKANEVIEEYQGQGFVLTLRQLYYQMVSKDIIPNTIKSYNNFGNLISDARLAGLVDWSAIEDRTRNLREMKHYKGPISALDEAIEAYHIDMWAITYQPYRLEVWIEKDALMGVVEGVCRKWDVPSFACRGYNSQSEMWRAGRRFKKYIGKGQKVRILHLGDHDPSGIDMTRDLRDRLKMFLSCGGEDAVKGWVPGESLRISRVALNMKQVEILHPPPNPAKVTDSRASKYIEKYGPYSWELDAIPPPLLVQIIEGNIGKWIDKDGWAHAGVKEEKEREWLRGLKKVKGREGREDA